MNHFGVYQNGRCQEKLHVQEDTTIRPRAVIEGVEKVVDDKDSLFAATPNTQPSMLTALTGVCEESVMCAEPLEKMLIVRKERRGKVCMGK